MTTINNNRHEILYLYDASYCNPNGDPADENKPRTDPETQINLVSDVRLKRTIRDYLREVKEKEIFVYAPQHKGIVPKAEQRAKDFYETLGSITNDNKDELDRNILSKCIDVRLFGCTIPIEIKGTKNSSITHTGPVQFKMGHSLHKVGVERIKGTGAFASAKGRQQSTFRVEYIVPYSFIAYYGVINEYRGKEVDLTTADIDDLYEAMWNGVRHLTTRSKTGQNPRLLVAITYKEGNFQISDLDRKIELSTDKDDLQLRSIDDFTVNVDMLLKAFEKAKERIEKIRLEIDEGLKFSLRGEEFGANEFIEKLENIGIKVERFGFW